MEKLTISHKRNTQESRKGFENVRKSRNFLSTTLEYEGGAAEYEDIADYYPRTMYVKGTVIA